MDFPKAYNQISEIICDKFTLQKLQNLQENQMVNLSLFPLILKTNNSLTFIVLDMTKSKASLSERTNQYKKDEFLKTTSDISIGNIAKQILTYSFTKLSLDDLLGEESTNLRIISLESKSINQMLKNCVILAFKLPHNFHEREDIMFNLEGYKFNPIGQLKQNWGFIDNGRVSKDIVCLSNDKVKRQLDRNILYSKNQLKSILEMIRKVSLLAFQPNENKKLASQLSLLGQNFIHHQKFILNSYNLIPVLTFELQLVCSIGRAQSCKSNGGSQNVLIREDLIENLCLNLEDGVDNCLKEVNIKVERLFDRKKGQNCLQTLSSNYLYTAMPLKMVNPHFFLKTENRDKFSQYYVKGLYEYYHYGDHNFSDQGWGCAYRSLETLLSWFRLQQKLNLHTVPTIPQIQNVIDLIDCTSEHKLSNSKTWIGATEVSWVVKKLTGFDCRILHIKDGKDIVEHAQIFRDHLENVGTPIMYGGDEYAYSIVGINYSWKLGQIIFCILDPHYNGSDKIEKIIQKKGICWRKPEQMFKKGVFYNFCLPIC